MKGTTFEKMLSRLSFRSVGRLCAAPYALEDFSWIAIDETDALAEDSCMRHVQKNFPDATLPPSVAGGKDNVTQLLILRFQEMLREGVLTQGTRLPSERLQFETACAALQSRAVTLEPGAATSWTFFGVFEPDHPAASSDADLVNGQVIVVDGGNVMPV